MPSPRKPPRMYGLDTFPRRRANGTSEATQRRHTQGRLLLETAQYLAALSAGDAPVIIHNMDNVSVPIRSAVDAHVPTLPGPIVEATQGQIVVPSKKAHRIEPLTLVDDSPSVETAGVGASMTPDSLSGGLPCPFAVADSDRYRRCCTLTMLTNGAVARHLRKQHRQPPYCPTCRATFKSRTLRDGHIRLRKCKLAEPTQLEGLDLRQFDSLRQYVNTPDASMATWDQISQLVSTPFLGP